MTFTLSLFLVPRQVKQLFGIWLLASFISSLVLLCKPHFQSDDIPIRNSKMVGNQTLQKVQHMQATTLQPE